MTQDERKEAVQFLHGLATAAHERMTGKRNMIIIPASSDQAIGLLFEEWTRLDKFEQKIKKAAKKARATNSPAQAAASAQNGKKGGRPRKAPAATE